MLHTTFSELKEAGACPARYHYLAKALIGVSHYGKDTPIPLGPINKEEWWEIQRIQGRCDSEIFEDWFEEGENVLKNCSLLEINGLNDTLWALRAVTVPAEREIRLFACDCAERVLPLFEKEYPTDKRPRQAIETARKFANGAATLEELDAARAAASAAASAAARAAASVASDAAWAAWDAASVASDAAWAAWAAASDAAWAAASDAASDAARAAASDAARDAEREWQKERLLGLLDSK